jgi:O-antigen ligase
VWKSGIELFTHSGKKMLFGLSFCGFTDYAKDNMPDTYIVNNDYQNMITLDNDILNIMVSNGIFGLLAAAAFVIYILVFVIKKFKTIKKEDAPMAAVVIAMLFALSCAAMFSSVMFYRFSPVAILFWAVLGQFMSYLEIGDNNKNEL